MKYRPDFISPEPAEKVLIKVPYDPNDISAEAVGSALTEAVLILMLAPNAPAPFAEVPNPLCSWTLEIIEDNAGILTQKTS